MKKQILLVVATILATTLIFALVACNSGGYFERYKDESSYAVSDSAILILGEGGVAENIHSIDVTWHDGSVSVEASDTNAIMFREAYESGEPQKDLVLRYRVVGNELVIKYARSGAGIKSGVFKKHLYVYVPKNLHLENVEIETASADVYVKNVKADEIDVESASGRVSVAADGAKVDVKTVSGAIAVEGCPDETDVASVSGDISIKPAVLPNNVGVSTTSGNVTVRVSGEQGFKVGFRSTSGQTLFINSFSNMPKIDGYYTYRDGGNCTIEIHTVSGNLTISERNGVI